MKRAPILSALLLACVTCHAKVNVFDMPERHMRHLQLLALMDAAHSSSNYAAMAAASREGVALGTADELWYYNLACALALQGIVKPAFAALDKAIERGFTDSEHLRLDPDLASLRGTDAFQQRLTLMAELRSNQSPSPNAVLTIRPDSQMTATQTSSNTLWSFQMGLFHAAVAAPTNTEGTYAGPEAESIRAWQTNGTASGCHGILYANRDNNTRPIDIARYPGLIRLAYSQEMADRRLNIGLPNTLFAFEKGLGLFPVIGHSSMGYMNSPYWRSQPRAVCGDTRQTALQSVFLLGNQLFFYPAYGDYEVSSGDCFPANTPYCFAVVGANHAEQPFLEAAFASLAALRPDTRAELTRSGLLMPTLHMLFRASQRTVKTRQDYFTGIAHPPAFQPANLDTPRLVRMAHDLTTNSIPPLVTLTVLSETRMIPNRDYFDRAPSERQFDSPLCVARIFRGAARTRTLELQTHCKRTDARIRWVVLQGDPAKVALAPCPTNSALMTLTVAHHEPFSTPIGSGKTIQTSRVDIGAFAETDDGVSLPSVVSIYFLGNEKRSYGADGRILTIDYNQRSSLYMDPLLSYSRNWKDSYQYDASGNLTGWIRTRGLAQERFTAYGHLVVAADARGRATKAHVVRYMPRQLKSDDTADGVPDLAQMDDNLEVAYRYTSDSDSIGTPDLSSLTQETEPPASEP